MNCKKNEQVAIDGPSASGKSTIARIISKELGGFYINSGDLYRGLTLLTIKNAIHPLEEKDRVIELLNNNDLYFKHFENDKIVSLFLNGKRINSKELRSPEVTSSVSLVARIPEVRGLMMDKQRSTQNLGFVIMDGRDIGTVIFPKARHKFFLTASAEERARRRLGQSDEIVTGSSLKSVTEEIVKRDEIDSSRSVAPLKCPDDAVRIDTTNLMVSQVVKKIVSVIQDRWHSDS